MSQISVFDMTGKKVTDTELNDEIFGIKPNKAILHAMVLQRGSGRTHTGRWFSPRPRVCGR